MIPGTPRDRLARPSYPRSASYDVQWQVNTMMGPNALWLTEAVTARMDLRPGGQLGIAVPGLAREIAMLEADGGDTLALVQMIARRDP